jgi:L-threonylcarbamoyladenylate synthase
MASNYTGVVSSLIVRCDVIAERQAGLHAARDALARGELVVMPTDTVYGVACDAFSPAAVNRLLAAKGRGRQMPPPVLVGSRGDVDRLVTSVPQGARKVMEAFWPGGVTIILSANPDVTWDLGETSGTVAIRMPDNDVALELLGLTGPLAVSSANLSGKPAALRVEDAIEQLGQTVSVYLDGGQVGQSYGASAADSGSTIVDATGIESGGSWRVVRHGVCPWEDIRAVAGGVWEQ